jgi:hypothetical protein
MNKDSKILEGGRPGTIIRTGNRVSRPAGPWSKSVHASLNHLHRQGFDAAPQPIELADGRETLSFLDGEVANDPPPAFFRDDTILVAAAHLLRRYHDAAVNFEIPDGAVWMHPAQENAQVVCHSDFAPYNTVFRNEMPVGIIDFDVAHPAPRLWDIAYALYRWVPCGNPAAAPERGSLEEQARRIRYFLEAYGLDRPHWPNAVAQMIIRLEALTASMQQKADAGDEKFQADIARGDLNLYLGDIAWLRHHDDSLSGFLGLD